MLYDQYAHMGSFERMARPLEPSRSDIDFAVELAQAEVLANIEDIIDSLSTAGFTAVDSDKATRSPEALQAAIGAEVVHAILIGTHRGDDASVIAAAKEWVRRTLASQEASIKERASELAREMAQ